mmetsp:Transcript_76033/g.137252  ORF Transcript_76033/g.137252 Transcript_76033/m.137252 type:complete len:249 (-) Transcript_76033:200-946(-)
MRWRPRCCWSSFWHLRFLRALGGHGCEDRVLALCECVIKSIRAGDNDGNAEFCLELWRDAFHVHLDDLGRARANPDDDGGVTILLDTCAQASKFAVVIQLCRNIALLELGHGVPGLGENHNAHGVLQEVAAGLRADDEEEGILDLLVEPRHAADGAEGVVVAGLALEGKSVIAGSCDRCCNRLARAFFCGKGYDSALVLCLPAARRAPGVRQGTDESDADAAERGHEWCIAAGSAVSTDGLRLRKGGE